MRRDSTGWGLVLVAAFAGACGGQSEQRALDTNVGGTSNSAGSGGTTIPSFAGMSGTAESGSSGQGGRGGADPSLLPPCLQPIESGPCEALIGRVAFDPETLECVEFTYGGCGANGNNFATLEECTAKCAERYSSCRSPERASECPCTEPEQCAGGHCSNASFEEGNGCLAYPVGYCKRFGEGSCICPLEGGNKICGV